MQRCVRASRLMIGALVLHEIVSIKCIMVTVITGGTACFKRHCTPMVLYLNALGQITSVPDAHACETSGAQHGAKVPAACLPHMHTCIS